MTCYGVKQVGRSMASHRLNEVEHMDFLPAVIRARYDGGFRIHFTFNDNLEGTLDLQGAG
jgi:hypothetical protein